MNWMSRQLPMVRALIVAAPLVLVSACTGVMTPNVSTSQTGSTMAPAIPQGTDPEDAVIGRREHPRIVAAYGGVYSDRKAEIMLASIVGRLLAAADQPNSQFTITILDSADVNAFALPGGYVYVTRGILALANDSSELAAVLAHEIAHVTLRHARARSTRARTTAIVDQVITGILGSDPNTDQASARSRMSLAAFNQSQELAADREGVLIAGKAGYDPHAAARFLGAMGRFASHVAGQSDAGNDDFLSSHPSTPNRIQKAIETARGSFGAPGIGITDREAYLAAIDGITFGDSPQQGAIVGRRFVHPSAKFTFTVPQGYTLQNSRTAVVGVAGDGEAVRFDSADVPTSMALDTYLKSGWIAGLRADTVRVQTVNGIEMAWGIASTDQWAFRVAVMRMDGKVHRFIFAAKSDDARFAQGADETMRSFRRTEARDLADIRSLKVRLVTAQAGDTADRLAQRMAPNTGGRELFYVLNNLFPGDPVSPGTKYKIVSNQ